MQKHKTSIWQKLGYFFLGIDKWTEETHSNKNKLASQLIKTEFKLNKVSQMPYYRKDRIYLFGKTMGTIK